MRLSSDILEGQSGALRRRDVSVPGYQRDHAPAIVHIGTGAFHRAHQASYFDQLMDQDGGSWLIQGASLRSESVASQLNPQDGLYTIVERSGDGRKYRIVGSVCGVLVAPHDPEALIQAIAAPDVVLVTLTVTEKGYRPALASGGLDMNDPGTVHDLESPDRPKTALGFIVAGLWRRWAADAAPLTLLSCDNMPDNGAALKRGVLALADHRDADFSRWIDQHCAFPSSMVDRIVPATTNADVEELEGSLGFVDEAMVKTEPFSQWVVEDWFAGTRPPLEKVGVQFTSDVAAWEKAKLRMLNGAHSALAYLGRLAGHQYVHDAIAAPGFRDFVDLLWDEAETTLDPVDGFSPAAYRAALLSRFSNRSLLHRTEQIAMDGSQKLPQRLLETIRARVQAGQQSPALILAVAAWMRWQTGVDEQGQTYTVDDPLADETSRRLILAGPDPLRMVEEIASIPAVFGDHFLRDTGLSDSLSNSLRALLNDGASTAIQSLFSGETGA